MTEPGMTIAEGGAGWLHNSGKLLFTQIKPAGLFERLRVFLVRRRFCFPLNPSCAASAI